VHRKEDHRLKQKEVQMQRRAFLIGGDYKNPDNVLSGVRDDILAWKRFLMSSIGGCWYENEIMDLSGQSKAQILETIQEGRSIDYSLVFFSGHGYLAKDRFGFSVTMTLLNDDIEMSERELNSGSPWCMQIFDCCRKGPENEKVAFSNEVLNKSFQHNTRLLFESELLKSERGLVKVFAADEGQAADDDRSFSRVLIEVAKGIIGRCQNGVLGINDAVSVARTVMPPQQTPVYMGGRRLHHFPFAVMPRVIYS
jgi:hypothetical protein